MLTVRVFGCVAAIGILFSGAARAQTSGASAAPSSSSPPPANADNQVIPRLIHAVDATVPPGALAPGTSAVVRLTLTVDTSGHVAEAVVNESAGPALDRAAVEAAQQLEFTPARLNGSPVAARIQYRFRLNSPIYDTISAAWHGTIRTIADQPVAAANIEVRLPSGAIVRTQSDAAGEFHLDVHETGEFGIAVNAAGFREFRERESIAPNDDLAVTYRLTAVVVPRQAALDNTEQGTTVRATRPPREVTRTTLERAEIVRSPGTLGDALRSIQNLPGLARAPFLSGSLIVRGSSPLDSAVFVDGTILPVLYHFGGLGSTIPTDMLDRIDFYPGNFSAQFGRATGGVVDVGLRSPAQDGARAAVSIGLLDASAFAEGAITPTLSVAVGARYAWLGYLVSPITSLAVGVKVFIGYWDYQGVIEWRPRPSDRVRLALLGDSDTVAFTPNDNSSRVSLIQGYHIAQASWTHDFAPGTQARISLSGGWTALQLNLNSRNSSGTDGLEAFPFGARAEFTHTISRFARLHVGLDGLFGTRTYRSGFTTGGMDSVQQTNTTIIQPGAYVEAVITPIEGLRLIPSMRVDYARTSAELIASPRLAARWEFLHDWVIKAGVGHYSQPPVTETLLVPSELLLLQGQIPPTTTLSWQRAVQTSVGVEHNFTPFISLSLEGFYKSIDHAMVGFPSIDLALTGEYTPPPTNINSNGLGRAYGLEVLLRHRFNRRFFGWIAYTLMRAERQDTPGGAWRPFEFDQTHNFIAVASYELGYGVNVGFRFRYVTGRPTTLTPVAFNADTGSYQTSVSVPWGGRVPDFHQLDIRIERRWRTQFGTMAAYLEVLNVYNQPNAESFQYSPDGTQRQPSGAYIPFFPNLGLRGEL